MSQALAGWQRSHYCTSLGEKDIGSAVTVMGWVQKRRDLGALVFIDLRDRTGILQLVFDAARCGQSCFERAGGLRGEFVIAVRGEVAARVGSNINPRMETGAIEIWVDELKILNATDVPPFTVEDDVKASEALRLKYRYLDLRRPTLQRALKTRHDVAMCARRYFDSQGFYEIETPMLIRSTPEGARDYIVPSRVHLGSFYALPQSPQLYKQLLMLSGFDRYFQITRCFRDEDLRADRQPEFTQIDIEMSFVDEQDVWQACEGMVASVMREVLGVSVGLPLPRMPYSEAMLRFGSDKPDTRFGLELACVTDWARDCGFKVFEDAAVGAVMALVVPGGAVNFSRRDIDALTEVAKLYGAKGMAWAAPEADGTARGSFTKFLKDGAFEALKSALSLNAGDIVFLVADAKTTACRSLGQVRLELGKRLGLIDESRFDFLWVTHFPLFEYDEEGASYAAAHHAFTSPLDEDMELLETDPGAVRAKAYDMVLNGVELGSGSIRIHSSELQQRIFKVMGFGPEETQRRFGFLIDAFRYGAPPHGGFAFGLDRLVMLLCGRDSIRDVIAFPKVQNASCLMAEAPAPVDEKQLEDAGIRIAVAGREGP